jgi:NADP-dependent 3-hydroxy acid dehydrogenase YdfG
LQERIYVISGASSGIGRALAIKLAGSDVVLGLVGRDAARLAHTAEACTSRGASVHALVADVRRRDELRASLLQFDADHPVDCVIANAGVSVGTSPTGEIETEDETFALLETNFTGALATALPLIPRMRARRRGRVVFISSIAALAPLWRGASCAGFNAIARSLPFHGRSYGFALLADAARAVASSRIERIPLPHCAAGMKLRLIRRHRRGWSKRLCALVRWPFEYTGHRADL